MRIVTAFLTGCLFGLGLLISGMTDTTKVQGWLDVFGAWDPTLAFVLGGALIPMAVAWRLAGTHCTSVLGAPMPAAPDTALDRRLIIGSTLFGAGWALVGLCPGPAMASLGFGGGSGLLFFASMIIGMISYQLAAGTPATSDQILEGGTS